jgi:hypothetical protein
MDVGDYIEIFFASGNTNVELFATASQTLPFQKPAAPSIVVNVHQIGVSVGSTSGSSGTSGTTGTSGTSGTKGTSGTSGSSGIDGTSGTAGTSGTSGTSGSSGSGGTSGTSGSSGGSCISYNLSCPAGGGDCDVDYEDCANVAQNLTIY